MLKSTNFWKIKYEEKATLVAEYQVALRALLGLGDNDPLPNIVDWQNTIASWKNNQPSQEEYDEIKQELEDSKEYLKWYIEVLEEEVENCEKIGEFDDSQQEYKDHAAMLKNKISEIQKFVGKSGEDEIEKSDNQQISNSEVGVEHNREEFNEDQGQIARQEIVPSSTN